MNRGIIYLIINKQTEHKYIGHTSLAVNKEWAQHIDRSKRMSSEPLHRAFREYGIHNFMIRELDEYDDNSLNKKLSSWIEKYRPEYNPIEIIEEEEEEIIPAYTPRIIKTKTKNSHLKPWNENTRSDGKHSGLKIRGKNLTTGVCKDYNSAREAAIEITGDGNKNGNILGAARKGGTAYGHRWLILEEKTKKKPVFGVNKKTELIEVRYESIAAAVRDLCEGSSNVGIIRSLRNPGRLTWRGYWWYYS